MSARTRGSSTSCANVVSQLSDLRSRSVSTRACRSRRPGRAASAPSRGLRASASSGRRGQIRDGRDPHARSRSHGLRPYPRDQRGGPVADRVQHPLRRQHAEPVGLVEVRGDLRQQLVRRQPDRAREPGLLLIRCFTAAALALREAARGGRGTPRRARRPRPVAPRRTIAITRARPLAVVRHVTRDQHHLRAAPVRGRERQGRVHAELARLVGGRHHDAPRAGSVPVATTTGLPRNSGRAAARPPRRTRPCRRVRSSARSHPNPARAGAARVARGPAGRWLQERLGRGRTGRAGTSKTGWVGVRDAPGFKTGWVRGGGPDRKGGEPDRAAGACTTSHTPTPDRTCGPLCIAYMHNVAHPHLAGDVW